MHRFAFTLLAGFALLATSVSSTLAEDPAQPSDKELAADMKLLQGNWELLHGMDVVGKPTIRSVKTIEGNRETLRRYDIQTGKKVHEHKVEFQLTTSGNVHVRTFYGVGGTPENGQSFVYKVDQKTFYDIPGLLHGDSCRNYQDTPTIWRWKRVEEKKLPKAADADSARSE